MRPVRGLILAAGLGTRLAPLTTGLPKPLFPVLNYPIIVHVIERMRAHGIVDLAINIHHLGAEIEEYLGSGERLGVNITWFREKELLGTGGILRRSAEFWQDSTLVVTAGDMLSTLDLTDLVAFHRRHDGLATVGTFLHGWPLEEFGGDVAVPRPGSTVVSEYQPKPGREARSRHAATGVWAFEPGVVTHLPQATVFDLNKDFLPPFAATGLLHAYTADHEFDDFGQAEGYVDGTALALEGKLGVRPREPEVAPGLFISPTAVIGAGVTLEAPVVIGPATVVEDGSRIEGPTVIGGGCVVEAGAIISNSVLLPGVRVARGQLVARALLGDSFRTVPAIREHHLPC
ncbi:nucleotidyltransferase family protein [Kribbella albertanoniae]|uniref:NDP-sugar synthase n=1 Tax=Kribbella albertanoniae TaxID=1266829 RepID=A0A4R4Q693_9ACTN|nr:NDP-sugar synthase [Kribbella albertanoniae]TDC30687.1 NDP-sugar synthase [Kribbella albertanoniae]